MADRIVILGGGTGGTLLANRLRRASATPADHGHRPRRQHVYEPGLLFVPFGLAEPDGIVRSRGSSCTRDRLRIAEIDRVEPASSSVHLPEGSRCPTTCW